MLGEVVRGAAERHGTTAAILRGAQVVSWEAIDRHADLAAAGLLAAGVGPGQVVASVLPSGAEWLVLAVALDRVGAIHAAVSSHLAPDERGAVVASVEAGLTVVDPECVTGLPLRTSVVVVERDGLLEELHGGQTAPSGRTVDPPTDRHTNVCFTSGTTGLAKGATFGVAQLRAITRIDLGSAAESWGGGAPMLASTHFAHVGMALKLPWYARTGSTLCVLDRWRAEDALELVARHRMPTVGGVAAQVALMLRCDRFDEFDLTCVERLVVGGAPSSPRLVEEARRRFGARYSIRYSSTESGGVGLATADDADDHEALHTVGRPRPGVEVRVVDEHGDPLPDGRTGELQLRSPAVTSGYWGDPEASAATVTPEGWVRTGDLAHVEESGCVVVDGRRTDMFIRGGYNVFPVEVEAVLETHPGVAAVAVVPRPDDVLGEVPVAFVVTRPGTPPPTLGDLRAHAAGRLARYKLPDELVVVDELPVTAGDKLDRRSLRRRLDHRRTDPEGDPTEEATP